MKHIMFFLVSLLLANLAQAEGYQVSTKSQWDQGLISYCQKYSYSDLECENLYLRSLDDPNRPVVEEGATQVQPVVEQPVSQPAEVIHRIELVDNHSVQQQMFAQPQVPVQGYWASLGRPFGLDIASEKRLGRCVEFRNGSSTLIRVAGVMVPPNGRVYVFFDLPMKGLVQDVWVERIDPRDGVTALGTCTPFIVMPTSETAKVNITDSCF